MRQRTPLRKVAIAISTVATVLVILVVALVGGGFWLWSSASVNTAGDVDFATPVAIPPLAPSRLDEQGRRVFDLDVRSGTHEFRRGTPTGTWGVNADYLGPTLRAQRGERVVVNVHNGVGEATSMHWHGMHLPAEMDGGPHQLIRPGRTWSPSWTIDQPAASLWYHPHLHGSTEEHVYRGVAGMFIVDDDRSRRLGLPDEYGVDDVPVIVQDKQLDRSGNLDYSARMMSPTGLLGQTLLVNGTTNPYLEVTTQRVRLRLLNASTARIYNFGLDDDRPFAVVGSDGGLLPTAVETKRVMLSPGERAEIVVTMRPGQRSVLRSYRADLGADLWGQRFAGGDDVLDLLELRAADSLRPSAGVPQQLAPAPGITPAQASRRRTFRLSGTDINGLDMDLGRIDEAVTVGDIEEWEVVNDDGTPHSFHVHDVQFRVITLDGDPPPAHLRGWKDTVYVAPGTTAQLLMRFTDYTDPDSPYMYHCHILRHEDRGMMGQFVVVKPGERAGTPPRRDHDDGADHDHASHGDG
jgi:suppressor of ftsI